MSSLNTLFPNKAPKFEPHITITTNVSVNLDDPVKTRDDVNKILSASAVALNSLPQNHSNLVTLGKIDSQRKFFKKLYFQVAKDPNLISFASIIRELFVITPQEIEQEDAKVNPHLYTKDSRGLLVKRRKLKKNLHSREKSTSDASLPSTGSKGSDVATKALDMNKIQAIAAAKASEWCIGEYDPHLSLVYSDLHPIDNALWRTIKTRVLDYLNVENCDSDDLVDNGLGWDGGVLKLILCEGDVNDWVELGSVDLH